MTMMGRNDSASITGLVLGIIGLIIFVVVIYELFLNRTWVAEHIPKEIKEAIPEPVTKAISSME
jgi:hypothetical protein